MREFSRRLHKVIPGGAHTYSRGDDQFPSNAPEILTRGKGAYVWDQNGKKYLDYGMGLRAVVLGYADERINNAAIEQINNGVSLTRPSMIELQAAEEFVSTIDSIDMVKFTKNGSNATSAAVKLARAYTGKEYVCFPKQHPFFSFDDWFIGTTVVNRGVPESSYSRSLTFDYNKIETLEELFQKYPNQIAAVIMEPATTVLPCPSECLEKCASGIMCKGCSHDHDNFLKKVSQLTKKNNALFILDEMITGFRWHIKGAQYFFGVDPDICTFGKAMANGFSVSCVAGKREIMQLGAIDVKRLERTFLLSTTNGAEMPGMAAHIKTLQIMKEEKVVEHLWSYGNALKAAMLEISSLNGISDYFEVVGSGVSLGFVCKNQNGEVSAEFRTLFLQEMLNNGVMMPWIAQSYAHQEEELKITMQALNRSFQVYKKALSEGVENYLIGEPVKPVFRKFN